MAQESPRSGGRPAGTPHGPVISGERARQGRIVLNTSARRQIFAAGLGLLVIVAILVGR
jgi:hypothetical protein